MTPAVHRAACSCRISGWLAGWTPVSSHDVPCGAWLGPSLILEGMHWGPRGSGGPNCDVDRNEVNVRFCISVAQGGPTALGQRRSLNDVPHEVRLGSRSSHNTIDGGANADDAIH